MTELPWVLIPASSALGRGSKASLSSLVGCMHDSPGLTVLWARVGEKHRPGLRPAAGL